MDKSFVWTKFGRRNSVGEALTIPDEAETRARWGGFAWTEDNQRKANEILGRYPAGREQSACLPLLDLAQRQVGEETQTQGWLPVPVIEFVARQIGVAYMRVFEVATFYTMYNLAPVGRYHVQVCGTTPCLLAGSDDVLAACKNHGLSKGRTTPDGLFTLTEVECLGACANAPMVQINDDNFEDLDYDRTTAVLQMLARGETPQPGSQTGRRDSCPAGGPTTLREMVDANHDYRVQWA
jgi:NADH-quinone oxidoreductase subunit E